MRRHLLTLEELSLDEIDQIHATAAAFKRSLTQGAERAAGSTGGEATSSSSQPLAEPADPAPAPLRGKRIVNLFLEPSTRTRMAFDMAAKRLGADVISLEGSASSTTKGETLRDTAENIQAMQADAIVIRHAAAGSPLYLSQILHIPIINAGDGAHEHPTQGLLDTFTMREHFAPEAGSLCPTLKGRRVVILGDILFSRVARSNIHALRKLGADVTIVGPATLVPHHFSALGVRVSHDLRHALADAEVVMLLRIQHERQSLSMFPSLGEYTGLFGLNKTRASWLHPDAIIMHPGPINRGVEIDSDLADGPHSVILNQVTNGIAIRMAVLHLCLGGQVLNEPAA
nr:aspartate carbamoyltransferase catalytic subunit [Cephaloticoccus primus]